MIHKFADLNSTSVLGRLARIPLRLVPADAVLTVRGGVIKGSRWIAGSSIHGAWLGSYERDKQDFIAKLVRPGMVVWDIGANAGFYTLAFARLVGKTGRVYAFEPLAENAQNILAHVRLNGVTNAVLVQAALSAEVGLSGFETGGLNAEGRLSDDGKDYLVPTWSVDEFLSGRPNARPDLLKIDVEGAESAVLMGARALLSSTAPDILLATHGVDEHKRCSSLLTDFGYALYQFDGSKVAGVAPERDEIFATQSDQFI